MEQGFATDAVRERLIVAGIRELEEHGLNDFSLRRVAMACELSCAAPYRHFRSKDDLILEIIRYINRQWTLLQEQITAAFPTDDRRRLLEIGIAHIRFWIANPNFRSVLLLDEPDTDSPRHRERNLINQGLERLIGGYCERKGLPSSRAEEISYEYRALIYGTVLMLGNQELANDQKTIAMVRERLNAILQP